MTRKKTVCVPVAGLGRSFLLGIFRQGKDLLALAGFHGSKPRLASATLFCWTWFAVDPRSWEDLRDSGRVGQQGGRYNKILPVLPVLEMFLHEVLLSSRFG